MELNHEIATAKTFELIRNHTQSATPTDPPADCVVCLDSHPTYTTFILPCGGKTPHHAHTRCYTKWIDTKRTLNCPYCGDLEATRNNAFCDICDGWFGHFPDECAQLLDIPEMPREYRGRFNGSRTISTRGRDNPSLRA